MIAANDALPTNRWLVGVWITLTEWPAWTARRASLERFVGRDPAADPEE